MCTVKICHLSITPGGASLLTDRKTRSQTAHSTCLGTQRQDASHTSDNADSKNEKKLVTRTHYLFLIPNPRVRHFHPLWEYVSGNKWKQNLIFFTSQTKNYTAELYVRLKVSLGLRLLVATSSLGFLLLFILVSLTKYSKKPQINYLLFVFCAFRKNT